MPEMSEMYRGKRAREKEAEGLKEASGVGPSSGIA